MKILIDLQSCQSGSKHGGIGRYSMNLASAMVRNSGAHEIHFLLNSSITEDLQELNAELQRLVPVDHIHMFSSVVPARESDDANKFRTRASEYVREALISSLQPDALFITSLIEGLGDDVITSVGNIFPSCSTAVILYDLIPLVEREKYLNDPRASAHYFRKLDEMKKAGLLLSISEFSRQEGIELLKLPSSQIKNISSAVDEKFQPTELPEEEIKAVKDKYGISDKFLMYTGSFDQRKNHAALIKAFAQLSLATRKGIQLLIVGNGWDGVYSRLRTIAAEAGLEPADILFAGKVPDQDLLALYNCCHLFVFPSLQEGFGLPVLEAMSCGTPVICSNVTSIPEVIDLDEALFDPYSVESISQKIAELLTNESLRKDIRQHGIIRAKEFSWDISAQKALAAIEQQFQPLHSELDAASVPTTIELINKVTALPEAAEATTSDLIALAIALEEVERVRYVTQQQLLRGKTNVGFITTWSSRCGIASYSEQLVKPLAVQPVIFAPYARELTHPDNWNVIRCWHQERDPLKILSARIDELEIETLVIQFNYGFFDFEMFSTFLEQQIDRKRKVIITLHSTTDPDGVEEKRLQRLTSSLSKCNSVLVHSKKDRKHLQQLGLENVSIFPHGVLEHTPRNARAVNARDFLIASYGFFLPNKGLLELIEAISILCAHGVSAKLIMVNSRYPAPESENLIKKAKEQIIRLNLHEQIRIIDDYLPDEESLALLEEADLLVYPYQKTGESSSAAVRTGLVTKRPVAVTPLPIFDDVKDAVFYLPGTSPQDISSGILEIIEQASIKSESFMKVMNQLEGWLKDHQFPEVSARLGELIAARNS
ncbi:glycosyl transferase group 1 [Pseudomonas knackmussii B13]|uniref:Glycosyl transferase group 1 n=1 Tax=Pseudomonas knackmussii (strain DSM 6978 / CCUG 54928 / LMG 23759 / B13) TaxID=1301098 RepID=A0A024HQE6_PSEKB|nr:glycosyltransferase [Pseudomonas knackmussii]CDF86802.1 glycosyl transferase group 1 [Pseudomonas knackmussii B13]